MPATQLTKRRWFRFSLATFLFVSLCIGGLIGGYQSGYRQGYTQGQATRYNETQVTESYNTASLIWSDLPDSDRKVAFDNLKDLIQSTISTEIWNDGRGNDIRLDPFGVENVIVIAPGETQKQIRDLLAQLEKLAVRGGAEQLLPVMQTLAAQGKSNSKAQDTVLPIIPPQNTKKGTDWFERYFRLTINGISKQWGRPAFQGKCTEGGFPNWSVDQQIATWPHGGGLSYLALRNVDGQLHIAAGWRDRG